MHEAAFDPEWIAPHPLLRAVVFVSEWQRRVNAAELPQGVATHVIGNAISPFALELAQDENLMARKKPYRAVYAGDPARGLIPLLEIWPRLHAADPRLTLEIYSDKVLHGARPDIAASFQAHLSALPGLAHVGKVGQAQLAAAMAGATWHLSPNPYPETSCITLLEALALGCTSVVTARAALPESAHGFATLVPVDNADDKHTNHVAVNGDAFVAAFACMAASQTDKGAQRAHFLAHHTWQAQAMRWVEMLESLSG